VDPDLNRQNIHWRDLRKHQKLRESQNYYRMIINEQRKGRYKSTLDQYAEMQLLDNNHRMYKMSTTNKPIEI